MKRLINFMCLFVFAISVFAQSLVHTVQAGETLESIAKKYNMSVYRIQQANPESQNYFYIGMKLNIPGKRESKSKEESQSVVSSQQQIVDDTHYTSRFYNMQNHGSVIEEVSFSDMISTGDAKDLLAGFSFGVSVNFGYKYFLHNNFFVEGMLGYSGRIMQSDIVKTGNDFSMNLHNITLPIHVGGFLPVSDKLAFGFFAGTRFDYAIAGNGESDGEKIKFSDIKKVENFKCLTPYLELGVDICLKSGAAIRFTYGHGLSKNFSKELGMSYISVGYGLLY